MAVPTSVFPAKTGDAFAPRPTLVASAPLIFWYAGAAALLCLFHVIALEASLAACAFAAGAVLISVLPASRYGWRDMPSLICLLMGGRYATSAIVAKTLEGDPLDSNLYAADLSFSVVFAGMIAVVSAAFISHALWNRTSLLQERYSTRALVALTILGAAGAIAIAIVGIPPRVGVRPDTGLFPTEIPGGFTALFASGFAIFCIGWLGYNLSVGKPALTAPFIIAMGLTIVVSLVLNGRAPSFSILFAAAAFVICFRIKIGASLLIVGAAALLFFIFVFGPAVTDARIFRQMGAISGGQDLIAVTIEQMGRHLVGDASHEPLRPVFNYHLNYLRHNDLFLIRLVTIQELDFVVALAGDQGTVGLAKFWDSIVTLLPSWFVTDKTDFNTDTLLWIYGAFEPGFESFIELTPFGNAYTYAGMPFLVGSMVAVFLTFFLYCRAFCPQFDRSLLAAFFIGYYILDLTGASVNMLIGNIFRVLPFHTVLFWYLGDGAITRRQS